VFPSAARDPRPKAGAPGHGRPRVLGRVVEDRVIQDERS
jgi:hypothetical protein